MGLRSPFAPLNRKGYSRRPGSTPPPPPPPPGGIGAPVISSFTVTPANPVVGQIMTAHVTVSSGTVTTVEFDYKGDGTFDTNGTPGVDDVTFAYDTPGTFTPSVRVVGPGGEDTASNGVITVSPAPPPVIDVLNYQKSSGSGMQSVSNYAVPTGPNKVLLVGIATVSSTAVDPRINSVLAGTVPMTEAVEVLQSNSARVSVSWWYILNPVETTVNIVATPVGAPVRSAMVAMTLTNVKQVPPLQVASQGVAAAVVNTDMLTLADFVQIFDIETHNIILAPTRNNAAQVLIDSFQLNSGGGLGQGTGVSWTPASTAGVTYTPGWTATGAARMAHALVGWERTSDAPVTPPDPPDPVGPPEILSFTATPTSLEEGQVVSAIIQANGEITSATIDFGEGDGPEAATVGQFLTHVYDTADTYVPHAVVTGPGGSDSADAATITVDPATPPPADEGFYADPPAPDQPASTSFGTAATIDLDFTAAMTGTTFARTGVAYDDSTGAFTSFATNTARRTNARGVLIEKGATNEVLNNGDLSSWTLEGATVLTGQTDFLSSPGTGACKLVEGSDVGERYALLASTAFTNGQLDKYHWLEVVVKAAGRTKGYIELTAGGDTAQRIRGVFDLVAETITLSRSGSGDNLPVRDTIVGNIVSLLNGAYKLVIGGILNLGDPSTANLQIRIGMLDDTGASNYDGDGSSGIIVWAVEIQTAYDKKTKSLGPVAGTAVTRNADSLTFSPSTTLDVAAGTLFFSLPEGGRPWGTLLDTTNGGLTGDGIRIGYDGYGNLRVRIKDTYLRTEPRNSYNGANPDAQFSDGTGAQNDTLPASVYKGIIVTYNNTGLNVHGWDGTYIWPLGTYSGDVGTPTAGASASLGHTIGNTHYLDNWIGKFMAYNVKITDANALWLFEQEGV